MSYGECPNCGEQCWLDASGGIDEEPNLLTTRKHQPNYDMGEDWEEVWKCPKCKTIFYELNGYP